MVHLEMYCCGVVNCGEFTYTTGFRPGTTGTAEPITWRGNILSGRSLGKRAVLSVRGDLTSRLNVSV